MTYEPIQTLEVENYGCIRKASFALSPLHALIGPNDSGKSTTLRALRTAAQFAAGLFEETNTVSPRPFNPMLDMQKGCTNIVLRYHDGLGYRLRTTDPRVMQVPVRPPVEARESVLVAGEERPPEGAARSAWNHLGTIHHNLSNAEMNLRQRITTATMVRFDPNALRRPSQQILAGQPIRFQDETGAGLASVLQAINSRDVDKFVAMRDRVRELFPHINNLLVPTEASNTVVLQVRLADGTVVPAPAVSDGLLYFLAYRALQELEDTRLFLVEEPENGLHPTRIAEVMDILKEISKTSQVVIATHSPLVLNELQGHEISVVTRTEAEGTQAILLKDVPGFEEASKVYLPGEFWVSYADGKTEEPLLTGRPRK